MDVELIGLAFDCADPIRVAGFWAEALGRTVSPGATEDLARIAPADPAKTGPLLTFHRVPEGKTVKNRLHLDISTGDLAGTTEQLLSLGATKLWDVEKGERHWTTMADPEGNEFDLIAASPPVSLTASPTGR
jgi:Glyoxalase-like domain